MNGLLVTVTACSLLLAFAFFLLWRGAHHDSRYYRRETDHWFDAWTRASTRPPWRDPADWWKGGGGG